MSASPKTSSNGPLIMAIKVFSITQIFYFHQLHDLRLRVKVVPLIFLWFVHLAYAFNAADETATFDLNFALDEEALDGSSDAENVDQG